MVLRLASQFARSLQALADVLALVALWLSAISLVVMLGYILAGILARYTGWFTLLGAEEIGAYSMAGLFFFGLAHTFRAGIFINVPFLYHRLRGRLLLFVDVLLLSLALVIAAVLAYYFWRYTLDSYHFHVVSIGEPQVPLYIPQLFMSVGTTVFCIQILALLVSRVVNAGPMPIRASETP